MVEFLGLNLPSPELNLSGISLRSALDGLCSGAVTQSGGHISPLHQHVAARLVLEGGFRPEWVKPRPGLASEHIKEEFATLTLDAASANTSEAKIVGGMRTKDVDVTIASPTLGPVLGVSAKSTANAFRNLTNRAEEAPGDAANIHMMYPGFSFGFVHCIKFVTVEMAGGDRKNASFENDGTPSQQLCRFHDMLSSLLGRFHIHDPDAKFESVALVVYRCPSNPGEKAALYQPYPAKESPLHYSKFYGRLYQTYDIRFGFRYKAYERRKWEMANPYSLSIDSELGSPWEIRVS